MVAVIAVGLGGGDRQPIRRLGRVDAREGVRVLTPYSTQFVRAFKNGRIDAVRHEARRDKQAR